MNNAFHSKRNRKNSLFIRMLSYFMTLLIPIIIIGLSSYSYSANKLKRDFSNMARMNLASSAKTIDIYLQTAQETSMNFFYDENVSGLLVPFNTLTTEQRADLKTISHIIQRSQNIVSSFIDSIFVYFDDKKVYGSEGIDDFDLFFNKYYRFIRYDTRFWTDLLQTEKMIESLPPSVVDCTNNLKEKSVIPIVAVSKVNKNNTAMVINISTETIYQTIKYGTTLENTNFLVLDTNNNIIVSSDNRYMNQNVTGKLVRYFRDSNKTEGEIRLFDTREYVTCVKSDIFGWKYFYIIPVKAFNVNADDILRMTVITCITLILLGILLSFVFSFNIYNPIKNIRDMLVEKSDSPDMQEVGKSRNELDAIGNCINYLLDKNKDFMLKFHKVSNEYMDASFIQLLRGYQLEHMEALNRMLKDIYEFNSDIYMCCNIQLDFTDAFYSEMQDTDRLNIMEGIKKIFWEVFSELLRTYVVEYKQNLYVCIINLDEENQKELLEPVLEKIAKYFEYDSRYCKITVGIGKTYKNLKNLWKSNNEAMASVDSKQPGMNFQIVRSDFVCLEDRIHFSFSDETKIINCLKAGDLNNLTEVAEAIIGRNKDNSISLKSVDMLFKELYNTGVRFVVENGFDIAEILSYEEEQLAGSENKGKWGYTERTEYILNFYRKVIELTSSKNEGRSGSLISMIIEYIEKNYEKDIYLEKVAIEMGVSVKYISRTFKQKTGVNLTDYISIVRIKKSKELLADSSANINEISQRVGIYSRATFLRLFKKFEGTSPSAFRKTSLMEKTDNIPNG